MSEMPVATPEESQEPSGEPEGNSGEPQAEPARRKLFPSERERELLLYAVAGLVFFLALGVSYLDEDAFISFRVVDNFVRGYGLRWNVDERVQVYTNPLWVLALAPLHAALPDISWASYLLSAAASTSAVYVVARRLAAQPLVLLIGFLFPLLLSQAFTDYTSSGLENPLLYLFGALFVERLLRSDSFSEEERRETWYRLSLYAGLSALTRADSFLLYAPALAALALRELKRLPWGRIALGAAPLLAWLAFAFVYYGTVFPNPKYAKLGGGIPQTTYLEFGVTYLVDMAKNDVVTFAGLLLAPVLALLGLTGREALGRIIGRDGGFVLLGAFLYELYVVWIGGDFMAGRHWASPFFLTGCVVALSLARAGEARWESSGSGELGAGASVGNVTESETHSADGLSEKIRWYIYAAAALLALRFVVQPITEQRGVIYPREQHRTAIVRAGEIRYQRYNCGFYEALFAPLGKPIQHTWSQNGLKEARRAARAQERHPDWTYVAVSSAAGKEAFYAGPLVHYIDPLGITDPLLARLPDSDGQIKLIGHLSRDIPSGYTKAIERGDTSGLQPHLREFYEHQRRIITGPLFDGQRLKTIWNMNLGKYDYLLRKYEEEKPQTVYWSH